MGDMCERVPAWGTPADTRERVAVAMGVAAPCGQSVAAVGIAAEREGSGRESPAAGVRPAGCAWELVPAWGTPADARERAVAAMGVAAPCRRSVAAVGIAAEREGSGRESPAAGVRPAGCTWELVPAWGTPADARERAVVVVVNGTDGNGALREAQAIAWEEIERVKERDARTKTAARASGSERLKAAAQAVRERAQDMRMSRA